MDKKGRKQAGNERSEEGMKQGRIKGMKEERTIEANEEGRKEERILILKVWE